MSDSKRERPPLPGRQKSINGVATMVQPRLTEDEKTGAEKCSRWHASGLRFSQPTMSQYEIPQLQDSGSTTPKTPQSQRATAEGRRL